METDLENVTRGEAVTTAIYGWQLHRNYDGRIFNRRYKLLAFGPKCLLVETLCGEISTIESLRKAPVEGCDVEFINSPLLW